MLFGMISGEIVWKINFIPICIGPEFVWILMQTCGMLNEEDKLVILYAPHLPSWNERLLSQYARPPKTEDSHALIKYKT